MKQEEDLEQESAFSELPNCTQAALGSARPLPLDEQDDITHACSAAQNQRIRESLVRLVSVDC